jgi:peptidoglycan/xylan/chitin deacetylase (PgdA/CDA1 family)/glycosyltransferase involved in cell wall biosynthesis
MNILMVLSQVEVTGAEVYAASISDKLIDRGHNVYIVSDTLTVPTRARYISLPLNKRKIYLQVKHLFKLIQIIRENNIMVIHSHSRVSCKLSYIASRLTGVPMIYTAHGHHHVHLSKKLFPAYGEYTLAICENVRDQIIKELHWDANKIEILRNGVDSNRYSPIHIPVKPDVPTVSIIGRLSGPKGDVAYKVLEEICIKNPIDSSIKINVVGGMVIPERFKKFQDRVSLSGFVGKVSDQIANSSVVIGSGRVAIESLMMGKPTIAFGEATYEGLVTTDNYQTVLRSNFGDIAESGSWDTSHLGQDISAGLQMEKIPEQLYTAITNSFNLDRVTDRIESIYQSIYSREKYEIPVLLYHRVINDPALAGKHGTYVTAKQLEAHLEYLHKNNYTPISFEDLSMINRFDKDKKYVILTFDDGYEDNYTLLFPMLKKFNFKAVIFMVTGKKENTWDYLDEGRTFPLLERSQILEMNRYGIEFGAHTMNHVDLTKVAVSEAKQEIEGSRAALENILGKKVTAFAYPYGSVNDTVKDLVKKAGFKYGIATVIGPLAIHEDIFNIRRIVAHPDTNLSRFARKVKGDYLYRKAKKRALTAGSVSAKDVLLTPMDVQSRRGGGRRAS